MGTKPFVTSFFLKKLKRNEIISYHEARCNQQRRKKRNKELDMHAFIPSIITPVINPHALQS